MIMAMTQTMTIEDRVALLEGQVRRIRRDAGFYRGAAGALAMALAGVALLAAAQQPAVPEVVQARRFEVINGEGNVVVAASSDPAGGQVTIWSTGRGSVVRLGANKEGGDLALWNNQGRNVLGAFATEAGAEVGLWSADGTRAQRLHSAAAGGQVDLYGPRAQLALSASGGAEGGAITLLNGLGSPVLAANADEQGAGSILALDAAGHRCFGAGASERGGRVQVFGPQGEPAVTASVSAISGGGYVELADEAGLRALTSSADAGGGGRIDLADEKGTVVFSVDALEGAGAALAIANSEGHRQFLVGTRPQGGLVNLFNSQGTTVLIAGAADDGGGAALSMKNGAGSQVLHAGCDKAGNGLVTVWGAEGGKPHSLAAR
jgi:hypothetical protein